ncbi:hypothetical protein LMG29542_08521 [Paraburkholderia humisilvae]|uniref:Tn3 transposase DDE domain-containing protein n=1 Tax=Paraburkholderia humisilvae TaxID=627669 RepID=A0A6J5F8L3_9BURK|nr:hypothetical protein LMG29542_08521 [Paraburkholderia humisilvae]
MNEVVLWNTIYMDAALAQLRVEGVQVCEEDVARLDPLGSASGTSTCPAATRSRSAKRWPGVSCGRRVIRMKATPKPPDGTPD